MNRISSAELILPGGLDHEFRCAKIDCHMDTRSCSRERPAGTTRAAWTRSFARYEQNTHPYSGLILRAYFARSIAKTIFFSGVNLGTTVRLCRPKLVAWDRSFRRRKLA
jgi:hypothetical protein